MELPQSPSVGTSPTIPPNRPIPKRDSTDPYISRPEDFHNEHAYQHPVADAAVAGAATQSQTQPESPSQPQSTTATATQALKETHDPRAAAAAVADKYLGIGKKIGSLLFLVWAIIAWATFPTAIIGIGLVPGVIFNFLLVSPKSVYKLTEIILDFAFGIGEAMQAADELGLDKVNIEITDWQKAVIIIYDAVVAIYLLLFIVTILISVCYISNNVVADIAGKAADLWAGSNTYASISAFCTNLTK